MALSKVLLIWSRFACSMVFTLFSLAFTCSYWVPLVCLLVSSTTKLHSQYVWLLGIYDAFPNCNKKDRRRNSSEWLRKVVFVGRGSHYIFWTASYNMLWSWRDVQRLHWLINAKGVGVWFLLSRAAVHGPTCFPHAPLIAQNNFHW